MKIAILSGKGGTGKTFVSVNLATVAENSTYVDCDVEEPNGRLFFRPEDVKTSIVSRIIPSFDETLCVGCRSCCDFCKFHALVYIKEKPMLFPDICHSCGGCEIVCQHGAISETAHEVGTVEEGVSAGTNVVTGILKLGEASAVQTIHATLDAGFKHGGDVFIDCPPGSSCSVMESVAHADYCLIVVEPTAFGFHNFQMVYELVNLLKKPCGIVINKFEASYAPLEEFCQTHKIDVLMTVPYSDALASSTACGEIASLRDTELCSSFKTLLATLRKAVDE